MVGKLSDKTIKFVDGDYIQFSCAQVEIKNLPVGKYIVFARADWKAEHRVRTIVCSVYASSPVQVKREYAKKYSDAIVRTMEEWL